MKVLPIRTFGTRLLLVMLFVSGVAALFVCAALVTKDILQVRQDTLRTLETHAKILRTHSVAALRFNDPEAGAETLAALEAIPAVGRAVILRPGGNPFATYGNHDGNPDDPAVSGHAHLFQGSTLLLSRPIEHDGDYLGTLQLWYDMAPTYARIRDNALVAAGVAAAAMVLSFLIGLRIRRLLSEPVRELVQVARRVADQQDYTERAVHDRNDDLGEVMDVFNSMLDTIELRQAELQKAHDELELRVKARTAELEAATRRAEAANRAKTDFLANMSHEIRTPMTAILGYSEMLQDPEHSPSHRLECIQTIRRNGNHLLGIISDILDISKIEAGHMTVECCPASLIGLIADVASVMRLRAGEKGLKLNVEYASPIPEIIQTDPTRLRQILMNLLGNAVKFTEQGSVTLRIELREASDDSGAQPSLQFDVIDTGIGLTADQVDRLFVPFAQADESVTRRFGGTGLGLAISRKLARLLGGDINLTSQPGRGSTFSVTVTAGPLDGIRMLESPTEIEAEIQSYNLEGASSPAPLPQLNGRVLLAEDGIDNQRLIRSILVTAGAEVSLVENGRLACEEIEKSQAVGKRYDLVLMDMQMPEMDGYTATRVLRETGCRLPIVALTAHALAGDRERCIQAGCDEYLTKPIDRRQLIETAGQFMSTVQSEQMPANGQHAPSPPAPPDTRTCAPNVSGDESVLRSDVADEPGMPELIEEFLIALPERLRELEQAILQQEMNALAVMAHKLKGAGGGYGYAPITEAARRLEHLARNDADMESIREGFHDLRRICEMARAGARSTSIPGNPAS